MAGNASRENGKKGGRPRGTGRPLAKTVALAKALLRDQELSIKATLEQLRRGMLFDIRQLFDEHGNLRPIQELSEAEAMPIAGIEVVKRKDGDDWDTVVKVRIIDRAKYVEMAARHLSLLIERKEITHVTKPDYSKLSDAELSQLEKTLAKATPAPPSAEAVH